MATFLPMSAPVAADFVSVVGAVAAAAASSIRRGMTVTNTSDTAMRVREGAVATNVTGTAVAAGAVYNVRTGALISVYCGTADKAFSTVAW